MAMSLDGFITGPDDRKGQGLGHNGGRLYNWYLARISTQLVRRKVQANS
jgi:hypothetical protein